MAIAVTAVIARCHVTSIFLLYRRQNNGWKVECKSIRADLYIYDFLYTYKAKRVLYIKHRASMHSGKFDNQITLRATLRANAIRYSN